MNSTLYNVVSWEYFKMLVKVNFNIDFVKIDDFFKDGVTWLSLENYENLNDLDILNSLATLRDFEGTLYVLTDASYQKKLGPFQVESTNMESFVSNHTENFGEGFLETDILVINFEQKLAWVFHHEGVYALINLS